MESTESNATLGLERALTMIRRRAWVIALCFVIATLAAFGFSKAQTKEYTATAALLFTNSNVAQQASGVQPVSQNDPQGQRDTNLALVQLAETVSQQTAAALHAGLSASQVKNAVSATEQRDSYVVAISSTWPSPVLAARIANGFANAFIQQERLSAQGTVQSAITLVEGQYAGLSRPQRAGPQGQSLLDHLESLKILKVMQSNTQLVQAASVPTSPSSPNVPRNVVLGALLGLFVGVAFALLLERLDRRVREPRDVEQALGLPMLALIPHGSTEDLSKRDGSDVKLQLEPFQMLRAHLRYFDVDREVRTLLVTSPQPAEGKTTIARSLAAAAASMGTRTLLIETDLRRPTLAERLGLELGTGLAGALVSHGSVEGAIQHVDVEARSNGSSAGRRLDVLAAGGVPPNPTELLESHAMEDLLIWAKQSYELVVIDTPPLSVVADAIPLMKRVDGVIIVSRLGLTTRDGLERLRSRLDKLDAPVLGVVVNDAPRRTREDYGYYSYGGKYATAEAAAISVAGSTPEG